MATLRVWRATATDEGAQRYSAHFVGSVLPELNATEGFESAVLLQRDEGGVSHIQVLTRWRSIEAIRAFSGDDVNLAVVEPEAQAALSSFDETVTHFTVVAESSSRTR
jgi:heme-degrading monooxygenase HmoA